MLVLLGSVVLENHDDARATTLGDIAFGLLFAVIGRVTTRKKRVTTG